MTISLFYKHLFIKTAFHLIYHLVLQNLSKHARFFSLSFSISTPNPCLFFFHFSSAISTKENNGGGFGIFLKQMTSDAPFSTPFWKVLFGSSSSGIKKSQLDIQCMRFVVWMKLQITSLLFRITDQ